VNIKNKIGGFNQFLNHVYCIYLCTTKSHFNDNWQRHV